MLQRRGALLFGRRDRRMHGAVTRDIAGGSSMAAMPFKAPPPSRQWSMSISVGGRRLSSQTVSRGSWPIVEITEGAYGAGCIRPELPDYLEEPPGPRP